MWPSRCKDNVYQKSLSYLYVNITNLSFWSFDAAIIFSRCQQELFGHVTIYTNHVKLHIFNWDHLFFPYLQEVH